MYNKRKSQAGVHHSDDHPILPETQYSKLSLPPLLMPRKTKNLGTLTNILVSTVTNCYTDVYQESFHSHKVENPFITDRVQVTHPPSLSSLHESCGAFYGLQEDHAILLTKNIASQALKARHQKWK